MDEYQRTAGRLMGVSKMRVSENGVYPPNGYLNMEHDDYCNHQTWGYTISDKGRPSLYNIPQNLISWVKLGSTEWMFFSLVVHFGGFMRILYIRTAASIWHICRWYRRLSMAIHFDFTSKLLMDMWWAKMVHTYIYIHTYNPRQPYITPHISHIQCGAPQVTNCRIS
jgi:hypothetical protein